MTTVIIKQGLKWVIDIRLIKPQTILKIFMAKNPKYDDKSQ